jgi:hypothetical protein
VLREVPRLSPVWSPEVFDPTAETFSPTGGMASARRSHTATLLNDGKVLVNRGTDDGTFLATAELYE